MARILVRRNGALLSSLGLVFGVALRFQREIAVSGAVTSMESFFNLQQVLFVVGCLDCNGYRTPAGSH